MSRKKKQARETDLKLRDHKIYLVGGLTHKFDRGSDVLIIYINLRRDTEEEIFIIELEVYPKTSCSEGFNPTQLIEYTYHEMHNRGPINLALQSPLFRRILAEYLRKNIQQIPVDFQEYIWGYIASLHGKEIFLRDLRRLKESLELLNPWKPEDGQIFIECARLAGANISQIYDMMQFPAVRDDNFEELVLENKKACFVVFWRSEDKQSDEFDLKLTIEKLINKWHGVVDFFVMDMSTETDTYRSYGVGCINPSFGFFRSADPSFRCRNMIEGYRMTRNLDYEIMTWLKVQV